MENKKESGRGFVNGWYGGGIDFPLVYGLGGGRDIWLGGGAPGWLGGGAPKPLGGVFLVMLLLSL